MTFLEAIELLFVISLILILLSKIVLLSLKGVSAFASNKKTFFTYVKSVFSIAFIWLWILEILHQSDFFKIAILPSSISELLIEELVLSVLGVTLQCLALIILAFAMVGYKSSWRFGFDSKRYGELITGGILKRSRNPFFLSLLLYFLGTAFVFPNWFFIAYAALAMPGIHFHILKEEKHLRLIYKQDYADYCSKVRRYF